MNQINQINKTNQSNQTNRRPLEIYGLIILRRQRLYFHIPLDYEYRRTCRRQGQQTLPVLGYYTLGLTKVERPVWSGPIADDEREPRVPGASFPFAVRAMEARRPCG